MRCRVSVSDAAGRAIWQLCAMRSASLVAPRFSLARWPHPLALPAELQSVRERLNAVPETLVNVLETALVDDPPLLRRDGGFVREG